MITQEEIDLRVCGGIAYLDANEPDWRALVYWRELNMESPSMCLLGQLARRTDKGSGFWPYLDTVTGPHNEGHASNWEWARANGFCLSGEDAGIPDGAKTWGEEAEEAFRKAYALLRKAWMSQAVS